MKEFKTVQEYYYFCSQGHCFAPCFEELTETCKQGWVKDFNEYRICKAPVKGEL